MNNVNFEYPTVQTCTDILDLTAGSTLTYDAELGRYVYSVEDEEIGATCVTSRSYSLSISPDVVLGNMREAGSNEGYFQLKETNVLEDLASFGQEVAMTDGAAFVAAEAAKYDICITCLNCGETQVLQAAQPAEAMALIVGERSPLEMSCTACGNTIALEFIRQTKVE